jgi:hypothetical protein
MAENDGPDVKQTEGQTILGGGPDSGESQTTGSSGSLGQTTEGNAQQTPKWTEQLPREYRDKFTGYESYKDFIKDAAEAIEIKPKAIIRPADDAPKEDWDRFYASVGRPDGPDGYEIEGEGLDGFKQAAHRLGLTNSQAKELYNWYGEQGKQRDQEIAKTAETVRESLKQEWGDKYNEKMKAIDRFAKQYGTPELQAELNNPLLGNNPNLIKAFASAGEALAPERLVEGKPAIQEKAPPHFTYSWMRDAYPKKKE